jgi:hypothetical protein
LGNYPAQGRRYGDFLCGLWETACTALDIPLTEGRRSSHSLRSLLPPWADARIGATPSRPSFVAGDGFPAELSVNWAREPELRVLFDSMGYPSHTLPGNDRTRHIQEILTPTAKSPPPAVLWHSVAWRPPGPTTHKAYFYLERWPFSQRRAVVDEIMTQLGLARAWQDARAELDAADGHQLIDGCAVDITDDADARVKIYHRHLDAGLAIMSQVGALALDHDADRAESAYRALTGDRNDAGEAPLSCLAFRSGLDRCAESTIYLRVSSLVESDAESVARTDTLLRREGRADTRFTALAAALATGPLTGSRGLLELVSYRAARRRGDIATYFRFPVFDPAPRSSMPPPAQAGHARD